MKTAISIPDRVFQSAERLARRLGMSRSELYSRAVAAFVEKLERADVTDGLNRVYAGEDSSLDSVLAALQSHSVREEW